MRIICTQEYDLLVNFVPADDFDQNAARVPVRPVKVLAVFIHEALRSVQDRLPAAITSQRLPVAHPSGSCC